MYILTKINSYSSDSKISYNIFLRIMNVFLCKDYDYLLLDLSSIDFIYDYIEEETHDIELPKNILNEYIIKICKMLENISSPDIHNKIIQTTNSLLRKVCDDQLNLNFPEIFPILQRIWQNKYNNNKITTTKISLIRSNLIRLIGLFVKKVGLFISDENNSNNTFYENYFNFIYQIIGYSLSMNSSERLKLYIIDVDNFSIDKYSNEVQLLKVLIIVLKLFVLEFGRFIDVKAIQF